MSPLKVVQQAKQQHFTQYPWLFACLNCFHCFTMLYRAIAITFKSLFNHIKKIFTKKTQVSQEIMKKTQDKKT